MSAGAARDGEYHQPSGVAPHERSVWRPVPGHTASPVLLGYRRCVRRARTCFLLLTAACGGRVAAGAGGAPNGDAGGGASTVCSPLQEGAGGSAEQTCRRGACTVEILCGGAVSCDTPQGNWTKLTPLTGATQGTSKGPLRRVGVGAMAAERALQGATASALSSARAVARRFFAAYLVLYLLPVPLSQLSSRVEAAWNGVAIGVVAAVDRTFFHLREPVSTALYGDTRYAYLRLVCLAVVASVATAGWSFAVARRRVDDGTPYDVARTYVRYALAAVMLLYGAMKLTGGQFPEPVPSRLLATLGETRPEVLMWDFMGRSLAYQALAGAASWRARCSCSRAAQRRSGRSCSPPSSRTSSSWTRLRRRA